MPKDIAYHNYYTLGQQDAERDFTPEDDIDLDALAELVHDEHDQEMGTAVVKAVRAAVIDEEDFEETHDFDDDVDVAEAYRQWSAGWVSQAVEMAESAAYTRASEMGD